MYKATTTIRLIAAIMLVLAFSHGVSDAAVVSLTTPESSVKPGDDIAVDVVVDGIPQGGLNCVRFRLNIEAPGIEVAGVQDLSQARQDAVSVATPVMMAPASTTRSGLGEFFYGGVGPSGVLTLDNELLTANSALFTFAHTHGAVRPVGGGPVARFMVHVGSGVEAENLRIYLTDVALLDGWVAYDITENRDVLVQLRCLTIPPNLAGMTLQEAQAALTGAGLVLGDVYEVANDGTLPTGVVLEQSIASDGKVLCESVVDVAVNTAPADVTQAYAMDKTADESGAATIFWTRSASQDAAGYRVYRQGSGGMVIDRYIGAPDAGSVEATGLVTGIPTGFVVTAVDIYGNESPGVPIIVTAMDDVPPVAVITGVSVGEYYNFDVTPSVNVSDAFLAEHRLTLNGVPYDLSRITAEGTYVLALEAVDASGNTTMDTVTFVIDKTAPAILAANLSEGGFYRFDVLPELDLYDVNPKSADYFLNGEPYVSGTAINDEGYYTLRVSAGDMAGNSSEHNVSFAIDKTAPACTIAAADPAYAMENTLYVTGATGLVISVTDDGTVQSGVGVAAYDIDGTGGWATYETAFSLSYVQDGPHAVSYRVTDTAGNECGPNGFDVVVDNTPPVTDISVGGTVHTDVSGTRYVSGVNSFTLSAEDVLSGVASTECRIDGGDWTAYASFALPDEGTHDIGYRSTDNLGNAEAERRLDMVVDKTPPVSEIAVEGPRYVSGGGVYVGAGSRFVISSTDTLSGVGSTEYRLDGDAWHAYEPFTIPLEGAHVIEYRGTDNLGNVEEARSYNVVVDNTAPALAVRVGEPNYTAGEGTLYVTGSTTFTLDTTDEFSGPSETEYRVDGGEWTAYAPFVVPDEGAHVIEYRGMDNLGNSRDAGVLAVVVDNTPPMSTYSFEARSYMDEGRVHLSPDSIVTLSAVDELSGVAGIYYRFDDGEYVGYASPFTLADLGYGDHVLDFYTVDNVDGTEKEWSIPLTLIGFDVETGVLNVPRVLVYTGGSDKAGQQEASRAWMRWFVASALKDMDVYYSLVYETDDFVDAFRSGIYNTYVIMDQSAPFSDVFISELGEAVNASNGLLVSGWGNNVKGRMEDILGVKFPGTEAGGDDALTLRLLDSPVSLAKDLTCYGDPLRTELAGGTIAGVLTSEGSPNPVVCATVTYNCAVVKGDMLVVSMSNPDKLIDHEEVVVGKLPVKAPIPDTLGSLEGNLTITGVSQNGITCQVKPTGIVQDFNYILSLKLLRVGQVVSEVSCTLDVDPESALDAGMKAGGFDVVSVERMNESKTGPDMPGVVLNEYGQGRTAFMSFNIADAAKAGDTEGYAALFANVIGYLLPQEAGTGPGSVVLTYTKLTVHGSGMNVVAREALDEGLVYMPLFGLCKDPPLEYGMSLKDGVPSGYRYFIRTPDDSGDYARRTELLLSHSGVTNPYGVFTHLLDVEGDSLDVSARVIEMLGALKLEYPDRADAISEWLGDFEDVLLMPEMTRGDLDEKIHSGVMLIRRLDNLKADTAAVRFDMDRLLGILQAKWSMAE